MTRGRIKIYTKEYLDLEAPKLDEWSKKEDALSLIDFCDDKPYLPKNLAEFGRTSEDFGFSLIKAKQRIIRNRERAVSSGKLHPVAWSRYASLSDRTLLSHEEKIKDREAFRRRKEQSDASDAAQVLISTIIKAASNTSRELVNDKKTD